AICFINLIPIKSDGNQIAPLPPPRTDGTNRALTTQQQPTKNKQLPDSYYNYELLLQPPTATSTTNRYFNYQPPLQLPTATSTTNRYFNYQPLLQLPTATSTTNRHFNYQLPTTNYQLPTTTTHTYYQYCNPLVLLSSPSELLQPLRTSQHQRKRSA
ncbi:hypothetical protein, partial [Paraburkholderia madseniana]|uniref:hypothetical protein n=1 Tax=Paraburkholderia madseniana TaxID=2599607 RepID=UPI001A7E8D25